MQTQVLFAFDIDEAEVAVVGELATVELLAVVNLIPLLFLEDELVFRVFVGVAGVDDVDDERIW